MSRARSPFPEEEPPNYNPEDPYADKVALIDHRHYLLGQHFIKEARARILREKLKECYATNGVNHYEMCKDIQEKYRESTKIAASADLARMVNPAIDLDPQERIAQEGRGAELDEFKGRLTRMLCI